MPNFSALLFSHLSDDNAQHQGQMLVLLGNTTFVFAPFSTLSEKANKITSKTHKRIEVEIAAGKYSLKTVEQLKIQLSNTWKRMFHPVRSSIPRNTSVVYVSLHRFSMSCVIERT